MSVREIKLIILTAILFAIKCLVTYSAIKQSKEQSKEQSNQLDREERNESNEHET